MRFCLRTDCFIPFCHFAHLCDTLQTFNTFITFYDQLFFVGYFKRPFFIFMVSDYDPNIKGHYT